MQQREVLASIRKTSIKQGTLIQHSEEQCLGVLLLESGTIRVFIESTEGKEATLFRLSAGEMCVLSATCIIEQIDFEIAIEAYTDVTLYSLDIVTFKNLASKNIYVECFMYKWLAERFSDVMWAMQQMLFLDIQQRIANFLYNEMLDKGTSVLVITHDEIARQIFSAREVVSRVLKKLANEKIVSLGRGMITVLDEKRLKDY